METDPICNEPREADALQSLDDRRRERYDEAVKTIWPFLRLSDRAPREIKSNAEIEDLTHAILALAAISRFDAANWRVHWILGKAYEALDDSARFYEHMNAAYSLNAADANVAREFVFACLRLGRGAEAVNAAEAAAGAAPNDPATIANLGLALFIHGQVNAAEAAARRALSIAPGDNVTESLLDAIIDVRDGRMSQPTSWQGD